MLRGRFYNNKVGTENRKKAVEYFQQAITVDPNYSLAYAERCMTYINLVGFSSFDPKEYMPKAEAAALKARALTPVSAIGWRSTVAARSAAARPRP